MIDSPTWMRSIGAPMMNVCHMNTIISSLHGELLGDLTWIDNPNSIILALPPLHDALRRDVLRTDDVVEIVEYLVDRNRH